MPTRRVCSGCWPNARLVAKKQTKVSADWISMSEVQARRNAIIRTKNLTIELTAWTGSKPILLTSSAQLELMIGFAKKSTFHKKTTRWAVAMSLLVPKQWIAL